MKRLTSVPVWLVRLMHYKGLSARLTIKPEERLSIAYAGELRAAALDGRLNCVWLHVANELAGKSTSVPRSAIARAMGLIPGTPDYLFLGDGICLAQEAKIGRNDLSPSQSDFRIWCETYNVPYRVFRSVDEGLQQLRDLGLLT